MKAKKIYNIYIDLECVYISRKNERCQEDKLAIECYTGD